MEIEVERKLKERAENESVEEAEMTYVVVDNHNELIHCIGVFKGLISALGRAYSFAYDVTDPAAIERGEYMISPWFNLDQNTGYGIGMRKKVGGEWVLDEALYILKASDYRF